MDEDFLKGSYKDRRSGRDRRSELRFERSDEAKFLLGKARFRASLRAGNCRAKSCWRRCREP